MTKSSKWLSLTAIILLLIMAVFHGSGFSYVKGIMDRSNAADFLKDIVPVLFAHPSIHLLGLAAFGMLATFMKSEGKKVFLLLSGLVGIDALLAFYLGGILPGILLLAAATLFIITGLRK